MLSSVLNSDYAVQVNIVIMRTFSRLREALGGQAVILHRLDSLENPSHHMAHKFIKFFQAIRELVSPPAQPKRKIGIGQNR